MQVGVTNATIDYIHQDVVVARSATWKLHGLKSTRCILTRHAINESFMFVVLVVRHAKRCCALCRTVVEAP
eukprot:scaffold538_cov166-Amphora_coffeaeformis.AAC.6